MRFLKADKVFNGREYLSSGSVLVLDNQNLLKEIIRENTLNGNEVEHLEGILCPGFINTHCHLELSHLKGQILQHTGLPEFARELMMRRHGLAKEMVADLIKQADHELYQNGVVAVGDICNGPESFAQKKESKIYYHSFIELIGFDPRVSETVLKSGLELLKSLKEAGLSGSLAAHAPYSVSNALLRAISQFDLENGLPLSLHNQESTAEALFLREGKGGIKELYEFLNIDISWFKPSGKSGLSGISSDLTARSILVHNTETGKKDIQSVEEKIIYWCFCPAANLYIENKLPDFQLFNGQNICIGTDSLASNSSLDVIKEVNLILENTKAFSMEAILRAATYNGAEALGLTKQYGSLLSGKNCGLNLLNEKNGKLNFIKKIC
jgi:cytosine/adenosine deaminase-related metal-dependent hydrolase